MSPSIFNMIKNNCIRIIYRKKNCKRLFLSGHYYSTRYTNLDLNYLCNPNNIAEIEDNILRRASNGNINLVQELYKKCEGNNKEKHWDNFMVEALKIPNRTLIHRDENTLIKTVGKQLPGTKKYREFSELSKDRWCRTEQLGHVVGHRGYYLLGELAELEQALIRLAVKKLLMHGFSLTSVPDILPAKDIENCGMATRGERTQVYRLDERHGKDLCLSGTSEMALATRLAGCKLDRSSLPLKLAAVSRCYRAETSSVSEERGVYRVHQFTKVEMFGVTKGDFESSQALQQELIDLQIEFLDSLGLHFRILDMASAELGDPAVRKVDLEAWLPGRDMWGELCSCSDCGDYQSRRHNLRIADDSSFAHTVNGTACAVPRTIMAIVETHQQDDGTVKLPEPLRNIMNRDVLGRKELCMPTLKRIRSKNIRNNK